MTSSGDISMQVLVLVACATPLLAAAVVLLGGGRGAVAARITVAGSAVAFAAALVLTVRVAAEGPVSVLVRAADGGVLAGLGVDRLGTVLLLLVLGIAATVQTFAARYLAGDPRAPRFFWGSSLLVAATAAMVCAATLICLAIAWTLAGAALLALLGLYRGHPDADEGVRRTLLAFAVGDLALWAAVIAATIAWGEVEPAGIGTGGAGFAGEGPLVTLVACLVVVAAAARSAQLPLQGWLPATLTAPTPVSALLHAGVVNAGGILLVRLSPIFGAAPAATWLAFAIGAATTVYGTALMLAKPDIKGSLVHSTMGQMGFMIMTCGLGAWAAAIFHLTGHGMYKASLFLGSGGAVRQGARARRSPPLPAPSGRPWMRPVLTFAIPAAALALAAAVLRPDLEGPTGEGALPALALATGAWLTWGRLRRRPDLGGVAVTAGAVLALAFAYLGGFGAFAAYLGPSFDGAGTAVVPLVAVAVVVLALGALALLGWAGRAGRIARPVGTAYVWALSAGHLAPRPPAPPPRAPRTTVPRAAAPRLAEPLSASTEGGL